MDDPKKVGHCVEVNEMVKMLRTNGEDCSCGARAPCECGCNATWVECIADEAADILAREHARRVELEAIVEKVHSVAIYAVEMNEHREDIMLFEDMVDIENKTRKAALAAREGGSDE